MEIEHVTLQTKRRSPRIAEKEEFVHRKINRKMNIGQRLDIIHRLEERFQRWIRQLCYGGASYSTHIGKRKHFTCFQELPTEIRLKVWNLALPGPRVIGVPSHRHPSLNGHLTKPSILHVCSESRKEALKSYTTFLQRSCSGSSRYVFVNFQIDTLYFSDISSKWMIRRGMATDPPRIELSVDNLSFNIIRHREWEAIPHGCLLSPHFGKLEKWAVVGSEIRLVSDDALFQSNVVVKHVHSILSDF